MSEFLAQFLPEQYVPLVIFMGCVFLAYLYMRYNIAILKVFFHFYDSVFSFVNRVFSLQASRIEQNIHRKVSLKNKAFLSGFYKTYDNIVVTLDLKREGIQPMGLALFIILSAFVLSFVVSRIFNFGLGLYFVSVAVCYFFIYVLFRILTVTRFEKRERQIMDAVDCLCGNISNGVLNAIRICVNTDGIHPDIRGYFSDFLMDVDTMKFSFSNAMYQLNSKLGPSFSDFALKAIDYEDRHEEALLETFASIVMINQQKRDIREQNARIFQEVLVSFFVSVAMIVVFVFMCIGLEPSVVTFFTQHWYGQMLVLIDICICALVLYFVMSLKAKEL